MDKINKFKFSLEVLEYFNKQTRSILKPNLIGLEGIQKGNFELHYNITLSLSERSLLDIVLSELQEKGLIQSAYRDIGCRGEDLIITDKGRKALEKRTLDKLDELLLSVSADINLIDLRYGAYEAILYKQTDWQRQVSTSLVELINHTLRTISPDEEIKSRDWFVPSKDSKSGITRKHRIRYFIEEKKAMGSKSSKEVVNEIWNLLEACKDKLENIKHTNDTYDEAEQIINLVEVALMNLLN